MTAWPIGLSTGCFYRRSIFDCLELIRESGFSMIEVCSSPKHLDYHDMDAVRRAAKQIAGLGMEAYSFHAPFAEHIDISEPDEERRENAVKEIFQAVDAAAALEVHYFVIHPGPENARIPPQEERLQRMQHTVGVLNRVAAHCHQRGIACVLENKLPHLLFGNSSDILWILDALEADHVGACFDTGHAHLAGDVSHLLGKLSGHLRMIHAHDNNGRGDDHLPPGEGEINWSRLFSQLVRDGFHGVFILEIEGGDDPAVTMERARKGRIFLRNTARSLVLGTLKSA